MLAGALLLTALVVFAVPGVEAHDCQGFLPTDCGPCGSDGAQHVHRMAFGVVYCSSVPTDIVEALP